MKYINTIHSFYPTLTKSEKKIADYIFEYKSKVIYDTLSELSQNIGVGEATILRFIHKIGYDNFQDFKFSISREDEIFEDVAGASFLERIEQNMIKAISDTRSLLVEHEVTRAIDAIDACSGLYFYGVGASGLAAQEGVSRFLLLGKHAKAIVDSHYQLMNSAILTVDDVVVAISLSGQTQEVIEAAALAKQKGATIIAITNYVQSSLASIADVVLLSAYKENPLDGGSLVAKISQLYVMDVLCTGYTVKNPEATLQAKELTARSTLGRLIK
ncbi:MAG: MurR/RpiR family transcriptional regulator [Erysipelotrichaceae bacterium]